MTVVRRNCRERAGERGSALLVVLVLAAIIAIALLREMPVAAFEARRQTEQLLIDRGNEYKHAVKLYVRRTGTYPGSLDALESTNNVRFLRRRFTDPFTKNADWRLLHAGPGGMLLDSKVDPNNPNGGGSVATSSGDGEQTVVEPVRAARRPELPVNGSASRKGGGPDDPQPDPTKPLLPPGQAARMTDNSPAGLQGQGEPTSSQADESNPKSLSGSGPVYGGLIAGVASKATGHSIKVLNKQSDYSLWEFYYNPAVDGLGSVAIAVPTPIGVNGTNAPGIRGGPPGQR